MLTALLASASAAADPEPGPLAPPIQEVTTPEETITLITGGWVDARDILRRVAAQAGLGLQMAPDVVAEVNIHLEDVPLQRALDSILEPVGLGYEILDGTLTVFRRALITRWYTFDYPVTKREGRGELEVSARRQLGGGSGGGGGGGEGSDENSSALTTSSTMAIWPQVIASLQTVVFEANEVYGGDMDAQGAMALSLSDTDGRVLVVNAMAGLVQVTAEWNRVRRVEALLERLEESLGKQVAIEVKILEVTLRDQTKTGINWSNMSGKYFGANFRSAEGLESPVLTMVLKNTPTTALLEAMSESGTVKVLSTPRISTLNNQKAIVRVVTEEVFFIANVEPAVISNGVATEPVVEYEPQIVPVGIVLDVTPQVGQDGFITLNVHPTISDIVGIAESPNEDTQPILAVRELDTVGRVRDGETLIIAGLVAEGSVNERSGVPILKDLPLLGYLFGSTSVRKTSTELVILLTPVVMEGVKIDEMADEAETAIMDRM
jgi:MSHA type pilus biogenesis protein MshL